MPSQKICRRKWSVPLRRSTWMTRTGMAYVLTHVSDQASSADSPQDLEMNRFDPNGKKGRGMFVKTPKGKKTKVRFVAAALRKS
jgi:ribosomal protein L28